jgi:FAD-dependent urate hydroxylase
MCLLSRGRNEVKRIMSASGIEHTNGEARTSTPLLVIGAGPYGLATAAYARRVGIEPFVVGQPMAFWRDSMPSGMFLRSGADWHLDAAREHTLIAYLEERGIDPADVDPIPVGLFIEYAAWFQEKAGVEVLPDMVRDLTRKDGRFEATLQSGRRVSAETVVAAPGITHFAVVPEWVEENLSPEHWSHTSTMINFEKLRGSRVLIIGGRQSAFEWAALLADEGADAIHVVHRHDPPDFAPADWSFVDGLMELTATIPGWFRNLPAEEREAVVGRFWAEGRLKLEPWLTPRLEKPSVHRWPRAFVRRCKELSDGRIEVELSNETRLVIDHVILATGYKPDMTKVPYLAGVLGDMELADGFPVLDEHFQSSMPGLFVTGFLATRDFGPFFGFVRGCPVAATLTVAGLNVALDRAPA